MTAIVTLQAGDYELRLAPEIGGSIAAFRWRGRDLMRGLESVDWPSGDLPPGPESLASFPLVPFSNRIKNGEFSVDGRTIRLPARNAQTPHALHGFGWTSLWQIVSEAKDTQDGAKRIVLEHHYQSGAWPWAYVARQIFCLRDTGLRHDLWLRNLGSEPMPAGLGFHPYFPKHDARVTFSCDGMWHSTPDCLPTHWQDLDTTPDILAGAAWDHVFTGRTGAIVIHRPDYRLEIRPDAALDHCVVYVPEGEDYFCLEPVSHMTNAVNRAQSHPSDRTGLFWLAPGDLVQMGVDYAVQPGR